MRYIGCSTRALNTRIYDHLGKSFRTAKSLQSPTFSAIREHSHNNSHPFSPTDFTIIARLQHESEVFMAEQILIDKYKPELNRQLQQALIYIITNHMFFVFTDINKKNSGSVHHAHNAIIIDFQMFILFKKIVYLEND